MSTDGPGSDPGPWQVIGTAAELSASGETGSPIVHVTEDSRATAVTDTAPAAAVAVAVPGSVTHMYNQYLTATLLLSGPKFIVGTGIGSC